MYVHVGDIHLVTPCVIVRYTDYVCKTQNLFCELHRYILVKERHTHNIVTKQ